MLLVTEVTMNIMKTNGGSGLLQVNSKIVDAGRAGGCVVVEKGRGEGGRGGDMEPSGVSREQSLQRCPKAFQKSSQRFL